MTHHDALEVTFGQLEERLGREITPREKFYLALAEACAPASSEFEDDNMAPLNTWDAYSHHV